MWFINSRGDVSYNGEPMPNFFRHKPLNRLMQSKGCSLLLSTSMLAVGITITVMSLQSFSSSNKIFLIGPILMTIGILGLSRSLMHYFKKVEGERRRQENRVRGRSRRGTVPRTQPPQRPTVQAQATRGGNLILQVSDVQRGDSDAARYLDPMDSDDNYPDDPPPYDAITATGSLVSSHVQFGSAPRSSLSSLPPYEEGLVNPALDLSTETFPAPPPYDIVAVQPPSYSAASEGRERTVYGLAYTIRPHNKPRRSRSSSVPTRRSVEEVAYRLAENLRRESFTGELEEEPENVQSEPPDNARSTPSLTDEETPTNNNEDEEEVTSVHDTVDSYLNNNRNSSHCHITVDNTDDSDDINKAPPIRNTLN